MLTSNRGEWSELYTLFKLIGDKTLKGGNENIEVAETVIYPIIKILRSESNGLVEYTLEDEIVIISRGEEVYRIPVDKFKSNAVALLETIKSSSATFAIPEVEEFMRDFDCISIKASSSNKADITIVIHDFRTSQQPVLGFSIKSQLGGSSTLLNAGKTTNFVYKVNNLNLSEDEIDEINNIDTRRKMKDRVKAIVERGGTFHFVETQNKIFFNNLVLIDSCLPTIIAEMLVEHYKGESSKMSDVLKSVEEQNPIGYDTSTKHRFYSYKIKRFLVDVALGMMPSKVWTGEYEAKGGYLIVKKDGEVLCYHIYNKSEFENYLVNNTKFETASTNRHHFGKLYKEENDLFFKMNLQIRYIK